jgi:hypothetical protein
MKSAQEIRESRKAKQQEKLKENTERINLELLEFEKVLNKYESDVEDDKAYITVPLIIKTKEVKTLLEQHGYIIDKISNDIKVNTTRVYLDKESYNIATKRNCSYIDDTIKNIKQGFKYTEDNLRKENVIHNKEMFGVEPSIIGSKETIDLIELIRKIKQVEGGLY